MSIKALMFAAVAAAGLSSGAAFAHTDDDGYRGDGYGRYERAGRDGRDFRYGDFEGRARRDERHDGYRDNDRDDNRRDYRYPNRYDYRYDNRAYSYHRGYGNGYRMEMRRGERLSSGYGRYYVVNDWQRHQRLYAPQRGYQWVQVGSDYALVAIATGIIAQVLLNN